MDERWTHTQPTEPGDYRVRHTMMAPADVVVVSKYGVLFVYPDDEPEQIVELSDIDSHHEWRRR